MKIANINTKSNYSLLKSNLSITSIIKKACENKQTHVFLADNNLYGSIEFVKAAKNNNLIPIVGLDIQYQNQPILMFPISKIGYQNIIKISSYTLQKLDFDINDFQEDVLFFTPDKSQIEIKTNNLYENYIDDLAINVAKYYESNDYEVIQIMDAIANEKKMTVEQLIESDEQLLLSYDQFASKFEKDIIAKTHLIFKKISWDFEIEKSQILNFNEKSNEQKKAFIEHTCTQNLLELLEVDSLPQVYLERLHYEIDIINKKNFNDYFLIVHDFISEAQNRKILVGPGRGSVAGSLVAYGLKITMVDPIKYNLLFERFLNPNRATMPDIDVDIMDSRRDEVIEYLFEKYGYEKVAHIITFQRMKAKMALRDVGRVLDFDLKLVNRISKLIATEYDFDILGAVKTNQELLRLYEDYPKLFDIANKLIGCPRQTGKHAAGIVLSEKKLIDVIPIQYELNNITTTQISMDYLEELGLIKMDLLGLSNLTIVNRLIKLIKILTKEDIDLRKIPLDNKKIYEQISRANTLGIFQLESPGMKKTLTLVKPKNIEDISIVSALFRPGPQNNIKLFVERRENKVAIENIDDRIKDITDVTNGIIIYQEQVIQIVTRVANFSPADADIFRKAMSKKQESVFNELKQQFLDSSIVNGYSSEKANEIFDYIEKFALYGFNHSHSISYSLISYWMMYFKVYFPVEFYSIALSSLEGSLDKIQLYCNEIIEAGINLEQPNINLSKRNFIISNQKIYFGFSSIKGIGNEISKKIVKARENLKTFETYQQAVAILSNEGIGEATLQILIKSGCFDQFNSKKYCLKNLKNILDVAKNIKSDGTFLFAPTLEEVEESDFLDIDFNQEQINLIGFSFSKEKSVPEEILNLRNDIDLKTLDNLEDISNVVVKITKITARMTKTNKEMAFIEIEDNTKKDRIACFIFTQIKDQIKSGHYYLVKIKKAARGNQLIGVESLYE